MATDPDEAAAAPIAFRRSSDCPAGSPSMAATDDPARRPSTMPEDRCKHVRVAQRRRDVVGQPQDERGAARFGPVQPRVRHAARDRRGDVDEIAVPVRPGAQDAVAEGDRVRLSPGHLLAERRAGIGDLVGRTGEGRPRAEGSVSVHQEASPVGGPVVAPIQLRVKQVDRPDVQRRRDPGPGAAVDEAVRRSRASPRRDRGTSRRAPASRRSAARHR